MRLPGGQRCRLLRIGQNISNLAEPCVDVCVEAAPQYTRSDESRASALRARLAELERQAEALRAIRQRLEQHVADLEVVRQPNIIV